MRSRTFKFISISFRAASSCSTDGQPSIALLGIILAVEVVERRGDCWASEKEVPKRKKTTAKTACLILLNDARGLESRRAPPFTLHTAIFSFSSGASPAHNAGGRVLPLRIYP